MSPRSGALGTDWIDLYCCTATTRGAGRGIMDACTRTWPRACAVSRARTGESSIAAANEYRRRGKRFIARRCTSAADRLARRARPAMPISRRDAAWHERTDAVMAYSASRRFFAGGTGYATPRNLARRERRDIWRGTRVRPTQVALGICAGSLRSRQSSHAQRDAPRRAIAAMQLTLSPEQCSGCGLSPTARAAEPVHDDDWSVCHTVVVPLVPTAECPILSCTAARSSRAGLSSACQSPVARPVDAAAMCRMTPSRFKSIPVPEWGSVAGSVRPPRIAPVS